MDVRDLSGLKQEKRYIFRDKRAHSFYPERAQKDRLIARKLFERDEWQRSDTILSYLSVNEEVDTRYILEHALLEGKRVALPRACWQDHSMSWYEISSLDDVEKTRFGLLEPLPQKERLLDISALLSHTLALVPGLSFDKYGNRLGYGGGFFDRFLAEFQGVSIGLARSEQMSESLHKMGLVDIHDVPVAFVICESAVWDCKKRRAV